MDKEHILITTISLQGQFLSSELYSGRFYLWTTNQQLFIYNWKKCLTILESYERPIYLEPIPSEQLTLDPIVFEDALVRSLSLSVSVTDTAIFNHILYFTSAEGLYQLDLSKNTSMPKQISSLSMETIQISPQGRMICTSLTHGLFEYLLTTRYVYANQEFKKASRFYLLDNNRTYAAEWDGQNIIQFFNEEKDVANYLSFSVKKGVIKLLQTQKLNKNSEIEENRVITQPLPFHLSSNKLFSKDIKLFSFEHDKKKVKLNETYEDKNCQLRLTPSIFSRQALFDFDRFIYLRDQKTELTLSFQGERLWTIPTGNIKQRRLFSRTIDFQNQLHVITHKAINLYIFTEIAL
ncbi:MAG: hypothetical protein L0K82_03660 [Pisciglobus halotolerans]|nr:hypothetical protein [Pisciglobus halotolerans]